MDPWREIERVTGKAVPSWAREGCLGPKLVHIPAGRTLYGAGPHSKTTMEWAAFEEHDLEWYMRGNQLNAEWYVKGKGLSIPIYEFSIAITAPTPAVMSKVAAQPGAPERTEPAKFQYYNPAGFGRPTRRRLLGYLS